MATTVYLETQSTDPAYNLAFEEYVLTNCRDGNYLILWQNANAVIIGRNQNTAEEIDQDFVNKHNIKVIRRNTGGGAVYHDMGNLNYSFITDADGVDQAATRLFMQPVVDALCSLGLNAECSGRNDILVDGKKVSGTAQQLSHGRILHHGTLLFDSNPDMLSGALNPDVTKFASKSVKSVRSRVGNIRSALKQDMTLNEFWGYLRKQLLQGDLAPSTLSPDALSEIQAKKAEKYDTWEWNFGKSPNFEIQNKQRWQGGLLDARLSVSKGLISQIRIYGDFLAMSPVAPIEEALTGCAYRQDSVLEALFGLDIAACLGGITKEELAQTVCGM